MKNNDKQHSLSNMLRERDGGNKSSHLADEEFEQISRTDTQEVSDRNKFSSNKMKNVLLLFVCIVLPVLSYYNVIKLPFFGNADSSASTEIMNDFEQGFTAGYNNANEIPANENQLSPYNDYLQKLSSGDIGKEFAGWEIDHLYESAVPITYLEGLHQADMIDQFEFWEISTLFGNGVTVDYLGELKRAGIIDIWEAWEIGNLYEDGVPALYLDDFSGADLLPHFSPAEITQLFNSGISATELRTISEQLDLNETTVNAIIDRADN